MYLFIFNILKCIRKCFLKICSKLIIRNKMEYLIKLVNLVCLIILIYNAIDMTIDFLKFDYEYKLFVDYNKDGIDLLPISVCTESHVLFGKRKVINNFDINLIHTKYENDAFNYIYDWTSIYDYIGRNDLSGEEIENKLHAFPDIHQDCNMNEKFQSRKWKEMKMYGSWKWMLNFCKNRFYQSYENMVFDEMSFDELNALTFESNELFSCSANVHNKDNTTIEANHTIDNCFDKYSVKKSIKANKEFGVCYTFFDKNNRILLGTEDYINISLNLQKQKEFIKNKHFNVEYIGIYSKYYFRLFIFLEKQNKVKGNVIELNRSPSDITMNIITETNELLSTPYMDFCKESGNYLIFIFQYFRERAH